MICEVAQALDYAHRARDKEGQDLRLVHRDVSPQNIMIGSDGVPKVLDFGIAKAVSNTVNTTTGKVSGKIRYMAPEQVRSETLDDRGDQFALGVVFWEMLTHRRLFGAEPDVSARIVERPVPPPSSINSQVSKAIDDVVIKMMAFDRKNRFENHTAVVQALQKLLKGAEQDYSAAARAAFMRSNLGIIFRSAESFQLSSEAIELEALPTPSPDQDDDLTKPVSNPIPIAKNAREAVSKPSWWYSVLGLLFVLTMLIAYLATGQN